MRSRRIAMSAAAVVLGAASLVGATTANAAMQPQQRPPGYFPVYVTGHGADAYAATIDGEHIILTACPESPTFATVASGQSSDGSWWATVEGFCYN